jgi:hypothetical protein
LKRSPENLKKHDGNDKPHKAVITKNQGYESVKKTIENANHLLMNLDETVDRSLTLSFTAFIVLPCSPNYIKEAEFPDMYWVPMKR